MKVTTELKEIIRQKVTEYNNRKTNEKQALPKEVRDKLKKVERIEKNLEKLKEELRIKYPWDKIEKNGFYYQYNKIKYHDNNEIFLNPNEVIAKLQYIDNKEGNEVLKAILKGDFSKVI